MALVSELAMEQASALQLQQSIKEKESLLEQCYRRMEQVECSPCIVVTGDNVIYCVTFTDLSLGML